MVRSYPKPHLENASRRFSALSSDFYDQGGMAERHHSISFVYRNDDASTMGPFKDFTPCRSGTRTRERQSISGGRRRTNVVPRRHGAGNPHAARGRETTSAEQDTAECRERR